MAKGSGAEDYIRQAIGPRVVGGIYRNGPHDTPYRVLDIRSDPKNGTWGIKVEAVDPNHPNAGAWRFGPTWHSTAWDPKRAEVMSMPKARLPKELKPEPTTYSEAISNVLQDWLDTGGGSTQ